MKIQKRDGSFEPISLDKIRYRLQKLKNDKDLGLLDIDIDTIALKVVSSIYDGVSSSELDEEASRIAVGMTENPDFQKLGSRIIISNLHKSTIECFSEVMELLYNNTDKSDKHSPILADDVIDIIRKNKNELNFAIDYKRDYMFDYFGFKTLEKSYLLKIYNNDLKKMIVVERPQHLYMRVAIGIHKDDIENTLKTYHLISQHFYTHASPSIFNSGTRLNNLSSCFLLGTHDSLEGIFKTITDCAKISKVGGGIGVHVSNIRAKGSIIRKTNGVSDGIVPMLKVYNDTSVYINQCFVGDTWVYSKDGPKYMENITTNDELITIDGTFKKVNEVIKNDINKEILEIRATNTLFPIKVTKEHELYLIKDQKKITNFNTIKNRLNKNIITPKFYNANELTENDIVGFPIPIYEQDNDIHDLDYYKFYGIMLGDGHICKGRNEYGVTLGNDTKQDIQIFVKNYLTKLNIHFWECDMNGCKSIRWSGSENLQLCRNMMYDKNDQKYIVNNYLHLPKQKIMKLIEGLLRTDGSNLKELCFTNTSINIIMQMRYMFLRLGILTSGNVKNYIGESHITKSGRTITTKQISYYLRIPKHPILESILKFNKKGQFLKYFEWNGILWGRVKSIKKINYSGYVYDFNMIDNHNYLTDMGLVHNSGKRKGSFAIYIEPHHADILEFLDLKKNQGSENMRARDLFYAIWMSDLFMKTVEENGDWYLMCPDECPGLTDAYGSDYEELYFKYVKEKRYKKVVKAHEIWTKILELQIEKGVPYISYKDNVNKKCNQKNLGTIKSSNLCNEISLFSNENEYAVCNLASVALPKYVEYDSENKPFFNFEKLREISEYIITPMNKVIDNNHYPTPEAEKSNMTHRPLGIGIQGLADVYFKMRLPADSNEASQLNKEIFETLYFGCMQGSINEAKKDGPYSSFKGSPFSQGKFQFDLAKDYDGIDLNNFLSGRWDWDALRQDLVKYGARNSMLTALMPTASTAQIMNNSEAFELVDSCIFKRRVLSGEFMVINKYLVKELQQLNLWDIDMKNLIIAHNGSIQNISTIPLDIKLIYRNVWEISMKTVIDQAKDRQVFVDQMQSMNLFMANPTISKLTSMHFYAWKNGGGKPSLKSGIYYLRSKSSYQSAKFSIDANLEKKLQDIKDDEECLACGS